MKSRRTLVVLPKGRQLHGGLARSQVMNLRKVSTIHIPPMDQSTSSAREREGKEAQNHDRP